MENKIVINEKKFHLAIHEWDDFTEGMLKSYSDWKCNGNQVPVVPPVDVPVMIDKESEVDELLPKLKKDISPLFPELQSLVESGEYGYTPIYSPILEHILKSVPDKLLGFVLVG